MLPRSSSFTSSCTESLPENLKSSSSSSTTTKTTTTTIHHYESLQNLQQSQRQTRPMLSRPLNIENNNHNIPIISHNIKRTTAGTILTSTHNLPEKKCDQQVDTMKRIIVQDDIENIQERLNEMLITVPITNDNDTLLLPTEQISTTQYYTPKISIDENGKKKLDEHDSHLINEENTTDSEDEVDDNDLYRK